MLSFTDQDIARTIDTGAWQRGQIIHANSAVIDVEINTTGTVISGRVRGTRPRPYQQMISLRPGNHGVIIHGTCSCPVRTNCKHVAAVLIEAEQRTTANRWEHGLAQGHIGVSAHNELPNLSPQLRHWLDNVEAAGKTSSRNEGAYPPEVKQRLIYVLSAAAASEGKCATTILRPMVANLLKSGKLGASPKPFDPSNVFGRQLGRYLRPVDHQILSELTWMMHRLGRSGGAGVALVGDRQAARLLSTVLATGRCHYETVHGPVLNEGPVRKAVARWQLEANAHQRLVIEPVHADSTVSNISSQDDDGASHAFETILPLAPPHYIELETGLVGPLNLGLPERFAAGLVAAPAISSREATALAAALETKLGPLGLADQIPMPTCPRTIKRRRRAPVPWLHMFLGSARIKPSYAWAVSDDTLQGGGFSVAMARASFGYGGDKSVSPEETADTFERFNGDDLIITPRNRHAEADALKQLHSHGLTTLSEGPVQLANEHAHDLVHASTNPSGLLDLITELNDPERAIAFSAEAIPQLVTAGWKVSYSDDYPYQIAEGDVGWWADIGEGSGIDWFSFDLGVEFEGERINLAPQLAELVARLSADMADLALSSDPAKMAELSAICQQLQLYHTLPDGRLLPLPGERLAPMLKALIELIGPRDDKQMDGRIRLHRAELAALSDFAAELGGDVAWAASAEQLIALGQMLRQGRTPKTVSLPPSFKASLRPYQQQGLDWLDFLRETGFGGILADDMGLGKTVQALAFLAHEKAQGRLDRPALILAPTSVLPNWQAEAARFTPTLSVLALRGPDRKQSFGDISRHDLVLTTYPLLMRDHDVLLKHEFHAAILDEAQAIKNPKATVSGFAHRINARHRLALTGTPLENNLGEVWSLFEFLAPGLLGDERAFRRVFRTPIEKHNCQTSQSFLTRRLKPFMLRRTKEEVATELPPKTEIIERIKLEGAQRDLYETVRVLMHEKVRAEIDKKGLARSHIVFLDALLKLRQICCDPRLLKMQLAKKAKRSAKLDRLMEMVPEMVAEGRRILIFSQFTSMLALIEAELDARAIPYVILTGTTKDRAAPVKEFQAGKAPVFLLSLKAGGTGLNLTAADTVIHYDPWWNPAVENQATDRAYRIGQDKPVFVYKIIVEEGIEEAIEVLKARKAALADALFAGASKSNFDLTEADISALFAPLNPAPMKLAA